MGRLNRVCRNCSVNGAGMLSDKSKKMIDKRLAGLISFFHNLDPGNKLKIAAYLCISVGVSVLMLVFMIGYPDAEFRNDYLIQTLCISVLSILIGSGLIKKYKWAHYLAISGSILSGGVLAIAMPASLLVILFSTLPEMKWKYACLIFLFVMVALPGYILLRPDVRKLFSKKEIQ